MGMAIDIETRTPGIGNNQRGLSGPAIKPVALRKMHQFHQVWKPHNIPIIGQGGITSARDAIEFLIAGASVIGLGTALFYDPLVCPRINRGILDYLQQHKLSGIHQLSGSLTLNTPPPAPCAGG
jgi:dihydroorotate dehydrogenase (NAD+) catalytic subunit